jgi:hypothetical protein
MAVGSKPLVVAQPTKTRLCCSWYSGDFLIEIHIQMVFDVSGVIAAFF